MSDLVDALLRSYAQILFSRRGVVGVAVLLATFVQPTAAMMGLLAAGVSLAVARVIRFGKEPTVDGLYGYSAVLVGLTFGALFSFSPRLVGWTMMAAMLATMLAAAWRSVLGGVLSVPMLSLPFLAVVVLLVPAGARLGLVPIAWVPVQGFLPPTAAGLETAIDGLGAIVLSPSPWAGALVLAALLVYSRIAVLLALWGMFGVAALLWMVPASIDPLNESLLYANGALAALALGGVWLVPSRSSFVLAAVGAGASTVLGLGLLFVVVPLGLPLLVLPFNVTVVALLVALRQRSEDRAPKSVDFLLGSPEENLRFMRTRLLRFGAHYSVRFHAPFLGTWTCTQGSDDGPTHLGPWKDAADFEVETEAGQWHRQPGSRLSDYACYDMPVLAPADGTVLRVMDGVHDNVPGEVNLDQNWGNVVITLHAPALVSVLAHLKPGSITVREGEVVRRGQQLAHCGASGRAPRPHLHFQLQATHRLGAPTLPHELHDVVLDRGKEAELVSTMTIEAGQAVRNLEADERMTRALRMVYGQTTRWRGSFGEERLQVDLDLYNQHVIRAAPSGATLFFEPDPRLFTIFDATEAQRSMLSLMTAALGRVPLEPNPHLTWTDVLPIDFLRSPIFSALQDFVAPFAPARGLAVRYSLEDRGDSFLVRGQSPSDQARRISTSAEVSPEHGIVRIDVTVDGRHLFAERTDLPTTTSSDNSSSVPSKTLPSTPSGVSP